MYEIKTGVGRTGNEATLSQTYETLYLTFYHWESQLLTLAKLCFYLPSHSLCMLFSSIYWEQYYSLRQYPTLVPTHPPRILDPANPSNNLYLTGIGGYSAHERVSEYEPGDGDWSAFKKNIHTLDLNKPVQHWLCT